MTVHREQYGMQSHNGVLILLILFVLCSVFHYCSDSDETPSGTTMYVDVEATLTPTAFPTPTETPRFWYAFVQEYYLLADAAGLFALGDWVPVMGITEYSEKRLWLPSIMEEGSAFDSFLFWTPEMARTFTVTSDNDTVQTPAGIFDGVIKLETGGYSWARYHFAPYYGFIRATTGSGRGNAAFKLESFYVYKSGNADEARYGLQLGNSWMYSISGNDTNGVSFIGTSNESIVGRKVIGNQNTWILRIQRKFYWD